MHRRVLVAGAPLAVALLAASVAANVDNVLVAAGALEPQDWSYCVGLPADTAFNGTQACPVAWPARYPLCGSGPQAPLNLAGSLGVDGSLRPLSLAWVSPRRVRIDVRPREGVSIVPLDVRPTLWEPNARAGYVLRQVDVFSPSAHAIGGARYDLELQFVHERRIDPTYAEHEGDGAGRWAAPEDGGADDVPHQVTVSLLYATNPVKADNEALRRAAFPLVADMSRDVTTGGVLPASGEYSYVADFAALAPASRDYVRYAAAAGAPPCGATAHYVMEDVGGVSSDQLGRIRTAMGFATTDGMAGATAAQAAAQPPAEPEGNGRPLQYAVPGGDSSPRRFVDYLGDALYTAEPAAAELNERAADFALAAVVLSSCSVAIALVAARLSQA